MGAKSVVGVLLFLFGCARGSASALVGLNPPPAKKVSMNALSGRKKGAVGKVVEFNPVRAMIQAGMVEDVVPSVAVAVARNGELLWEEGFGWADRENRVPATEHTMYATASVTKNFTATALMLLRERKQLDLDRSVNDYLGSALLTSPKWDPAGATVRRVAMHTAGLTTFDGGGRLPIEETIRRYGTLFWRPGERFDYSNLGPSILAHVISRVSGRSYAEFLRDEIFLPLGMTHASVGIGAGLEKHIAASYLGGRERIVSQGNLTPGGSGAFCSAHDLALFGMFHLKAHLPSQKAILPDAAIDAMQKETVATGDGGQYGLGWWIDEDHHGYRSVLGQGGNSFATAVLRLLPSEGIVVAALANTGSSLPWKAVDEVLSTLLPSYREKRARDTGGEKPRPPDAPLPAVLTGDWKGKIQTDRRDHEFALSIPASGDIHARIGSQLETLLNNARFSGSQLRGRMLGDPDTEELNGVLRFYLTLEGDLLYGAVETSPRSGGLFSYWVELRK